jgi:hypothetical protein
VMVSAQILAPSKAARENPLRFINIILPINATFRRYFSLNSSS